MLKKTITYVDFNEIECVEDFYFNISKAEIAELQLSESEGFAEMLQKIVESKDSSQIIAKFKQIILLAIGVKSEDGKRFIKSQEIKDNFMQSNAFSELFVELATDATAASEFVNGVIPKDMAAAGAEAQARPATQDHLQKKTNVKELEASDPEREEFEKWKAAKDAAKVLAEGEPVADVVDAEIVEELVTPAEESATQ